MDLEVSEAEALKMVLTAGPKRRQHKEAMEVPQCDGLGRTTESLVCLLSLRTKNAVLRLASASVYSLDTTLREMTTAQALLLALFDALLSEDVPGCALLLQLASTVEQLRSSYLEVWLREDFHFQKDEVRKVLAVMDRTELVVPDFIARVFSGLVKKYGLSDPGRPARKEFGNRQRMRSPSPKVETPPPELERPTTELDLVKKCLGLSISAGPDDVLMSSCRTDLEGYTLMHRLAEAGHREGVEQLLEVGVSWAQRGPSGVTALHCAAENGQLGVLEVLLRKGADLCGAREDGNAPLHLAAGMGHVDTVGWLVDHGANIEARNGKGQTALHTAAAGGHARTVKALLDLLAEHRRIEGARLGAIPKGLGSLDPKDEEGCTPLHLAARANMPEVVRLLLHHGADATAVTAEGMTPLNEATLWAAFDAVKILLDVGASLGKKTRRK